MAKKSRLPPRSRAQIRHDAPPILSRIWAEELWTPESEQRVDERDATSNWKPARGNVLH